MYLNTLLTPEEFDDYGPNGLQVPGRREITTVVSGVSVCQELFDRAVQSRAELVIVHHGLFWKNLPLSLSPIMASRLRTLLTNDINLAAYHLPLDAHPVHGNNACIAKELELEQVQPFGSYGKNKIGCIGMLPHPCSFSQLLTKVEKITQRKALTFQQGPQQIQRIGIVSGGGSNSLHEAIASGCDAFITGEPTEWTMNIANEGRIHYIAAGHYATETFGVKEIGKLLAQKFDITEFFVDIENPI